MIEYLLVLTTHFTNIELINKIFKIYKKLFNISFNLEFDKVIKFVDDRKGHDFCYKINNSKLINNFNWHPKYNFDKGIEKPLIGMLIKI